MGNAPVGERLEFCSFIIFPLRLRHLTKTFPERRSEVEHFVRGFPVTERLWIALVGQAGLHSRMIDECSAGEHRQFDESVPLIQVSQAIRLCLGNLLTHERPQLLIGQAVAYVIATQLRNLLFQLLLRRPVPSPITDLTGAFSTWIEQCLITLQGVLLMS